MRLKLIGGGVRLALALAILKKWLPNPKLECLQWLEGECIKSSPPR